MQQNFIGTVRNHFPGGIEPYTYFVSWTSNPPPSVYPESWFWYNHREAVLANTYEDKNCVSAGGFDSTAFAILRGIGDFLNLGITRVAHQSSSPATFRLEQNYPNPFNPTTNVSFVIGHSTFVSVKVFDVLGREVGTLVNEVKAPGSYSVQFDASNLASGIYFYRLATPTFVQTKSMSLMR